MSKLILLIARFYNFLATVFIDLLWWKSTSNQNNKCSQYFHFWMWIWNLHSVSLQICICNLRKKIAFQCNLVRFLPLHTKCACECPRKPILTDFERTTEVFFVNLTCRRVLFDVWFFRTKTTQITICFDEKIYKKSGKQRCSSARVSVKIQDKVQ